jgi:hypothetical protein
MKTETDYKKNSRTASIITAIGALVMIIAFVLFLIINKHKSEKIEATTSELNVKDSINSALHDTIRTLRPILEPISYAVPTGRVSHPGVSYMPKESPEFVYYLCLSVADSLKSQIIRVSYYLNDPTFRQKLYTSENRLDSFKISYRGWGCLDNVPIYIEKDDNSKDTVYFRMCDNLQLKGQSVAVH